MTAEEKLREEVTALTHRMVVARVATRWRDGYTDEEMDEWLSDYSDSLLECLGINEYRTAIKDFCEQHRRRIRQPTAVHWTIKQLLDLDRPNS